MVYLLKMVIFHGYVSSPEGNMIYSWSGDLPNVDSEKKVAARPRGHTGTTGSTSGYIMTPGLTNWMGTKKSNMLSFAIEK